MSCDTVTETLTDSTRVGNVGPELATREHAVPLRQAVRGWAVREENVEALRMVHAEGGLDILHPDSPRGESSWVQRLYHTVAPPTVCF